MITKVPKRPLKKPEKLKSPSGEKAPENKPSSTIDREITSTKPPSMNRPTSPKQKSRSEVSTSPEIPNGTFEKLKEADIVPVLSNKDKKPPPVPPKKPKFQSKSVVRTPDESRPLSTVQIPPQSKSEVHSTSPSSQKPEVHSSPSTSPKPEVRSSPSSSPKPKVHSSPPSSPKPEVHSPPPSPKLVRV